MPTIVELFTPRGLQIRDTADCKSALRRRQMDAPIVRWPLLKCWTESDHRNSVSTLAKSGGRALVGTTFGNFSEKLMRERKFRTKFSRISNKDWLH
jgi:hypothetical protein